MASMLQKLTYRIDSEIDIQATPEQVWKVFGDFASWGKWNDFMELPVAPERAGKHCRVLFHLDGGCMKESPHDPEVLVLDENRELRWRDYRGPLVSQFFRGSHWWILEPLPNGHTRFLHGAQMHGLLLPFIQPSMHATRRGYHVWNKALRQEVLARVHQQQRGQEGGPAQGAASTLQQQEGGKVQEGMQEDQPAHRGMRTRLQERLVGAAVSAVAKVQRKKSKRQAGGHKAGKAGGEGVPTAAVGLVGGEAAVLTGVAV